MFNAFYCKQRFRYLDKDLQDWDSIMYAGHERINKTASFIGNNLNFYIDTSDGVNEDLKIKEYCGRIKKIISECNGKSFLFFKSAYSQKWSKNIEELAMKNNGKVIPFFKWSFNNNFYKFVYGKRDKLIAKYKNTPKLYDVGYFCSLNKYSYPKPSSSDPLVSWSDHEKFGIRGNSNDTGVYYNLSRMNIYNIIKQSKFSIYNPGKVSYEDYIKESFKCKTIVNPPGIGEYTSRMFDQSYLGNCIVLRSTSYDNCLSWKSHFKEIDFYDQGWEEKMENIINNYKNLGNLANDYFENHWSSTAICNYLKSHVIKETNKEGENDRS